jgi:hypothetical protein
MERGRSRAPTVGGLTCGGVCQMLQGVLLKRVRGADDEEEGLREVTARNVAASCVIDMQVDSL